MTRIRTVAVVLGALLLATLIPTAAAAATRPIQFQATVGDRCIDGRASDNVDVRLVWKDASGQLKGRATVETGEFGFWFHCFPNEPGLAVAIGDRIKGTSEGSSRTFVVPRLTVVVDRAQDIFKGRAPAGSRVRLHHASPLSDVIETVRVRAGSNGRWSYDPDRNIIGGYFVILEWHSPKMDEVWVNGIAPSLTVTLGKPRFSGDTRPGRTIEIALDRAAGPDATGIAVGNPRGRFSGKFRDDGGDRVSVAAGDHVSAPALSSDADWIVPQVNGNANTGTDVVRGRCFDTGASGELVRIIVQGPSGNHRGFAITGTDSVGRFRVDFSRDPELFFDPANIRSGDRITIACMLEEGDWVQKRFVVP